MMSCEGPKMKVSAIGLLFLSLSCVVSSVDDAPPRRYIYTQPIEWRWIGVLVCTIIIIAYASYQCMGIDDRQHRGYQRLPTNDRDRYGDGDGGSKGDDRETIKGLGTLRFIATLHVTFCMFNNFNYDGAYSSCMTFLFNSGTNGVSFDEKMSKASNYVQQRLDKCDILSENIYYLQNIASFPIPVDESDRIPFMKYGYSWIPWFIMLSGFVLSFSSTLHVRGAKGRERERRSIETIPWATFLYNRLWRIYPLYLLCYLIVSARTTYDATSIGRDGGKGQYVVDLLLMQTWYPLWTEQALMPHTWFLSCLMPMWAMHGALLRYMKKFNSSTLLKIFGVYSVLIWLIFSIWSMSKYLVFDYMEWNQFHVYGEFRDSSNKPMEILVIMLLYHPFFYFPLYSCGVALSVIMARENAPKLESLTEEVNLLAEKMILHGSAASPLKVIPVVILEYGTSIGFTGILLCLVLADVYNFHGAVLGFRLGMLLPFHASLIAGLSYSASSSSPSASASSSSSSSSTSSSYPDPMRHILELPFLSCFGAISYSQYIFQFVLFYFWTSEHLSSTFFVFCTASSVLISLLVDLPLKQKEWTKGIFGMCIIYGILSGYLVDDFDALSPLSHKVGFDQQIVPILKNASFGEYHWINPSVLREGGVLWVAARRHRITNVNETGHLFPSGGLGMLWHSDIGITKLDAMTMLPLAPFEIICDNYPAVPFTPCHIYEYSFTDGPEDPRLFVNENDGNAIYLTFVTGALNDKKHCLQTQVVMKVGDCSSAKMLYDVKEGVPTKNWMYMGSDETIEDPKNSLKDNYLFMTNVIDQTVFSVNPRTGKSVISSQASHDDPMIPAGMHGGANMIRFSSVVDSVEVWMTVVHTSRPYVNYLVEFEFEKPHKCRRLSKPLPLTMLPSDYAHVLAFASGITKLDDDDEKIAISYGSADVYSFVTVLERDGIEALFDLDEDTVSIFSSKVNRNID